MCRRIEIHDRSIQDWSRNFNALNVAVCFLLLWFLFCGLGVIGHWWANADQVSVAIGVINPSNRGPIFVNAECPCGETSLFAAIGAVPVTYKLFDCVGCVLQWIVVGVHFSLLNLANFFTDG